MSGVTIRHLQIFLKVVECGKMNTAAKELFISQPSVSQAVREIEAYYDVRLFERLSQKLYITEEGKQLLGYARHITEAFSQMDGAMKRAGEHPRLQVGASVTVGTCLLHSLMEKVQEDMDITVVVSNTSEIEQRIVDSRLDVGIVEGAVSEEDLIKIPLCKDELVVVAGKKNCFYRCKSILPEQLDGQNVIAREEGSQNRNQYERLLAEKKIVLRPKWVCTNTEAIKQAVMESDGIAILSRLLVEREVREERLRIIPVEGCEVIRDITLIYHKNKYVSSSLQKWIKAAHSQLA